MASQKPTLILKQSCMLTWTLESKKLIHCKPNSSNCTIWRGRELESAVHDVNFDHQNIPFVSNFAWHEGISLWLMCEPTIPSPSIDSHIFGL